MGDGTWNARPARGSAGDGVSEQMQSDRDLLRSLARWLRKHDCLAFDSITDTGADEQERAEELISWLAESVDVLNVPPRAARAGGGQ
jgi:hypothetical protein